ncbi:MAG TPA: hypothetical protein VLD61_03875, partial [Methylomirabilota bacterium]|nr:hypothetical protein [Methylomirabilota bacterium]
DHSYTLMHALWARGTVDLLRGNVEGALPALQRGLVVGRVANIPLLFPFVAAPLGAACSLGGRPDEGIALLEESVERAAEMRLLAGHPQRLTWLGQARLSRGEGEAAARLAVQALELAEQLGERGHHAHALRLLAEVEATRNPPDAERAAETYRQVMDVAAGLEMRPLLAHSRLGLGRLLGLSGHRDEAEAHITAAGSLYAEMQAPGWIEAVAAVRRSLG